MVKTLKLKVPSRVKEDPFFDVKRSDRDAPYILAGVEEGIMFAFPDGTFKPDQALTVAEAFDILVNNDILDTDELNVDKSPCTRLALAEMMKEINQYNERVEYLLNWDKGFTLEQRFMKHILLIGFRGDCLIIWSNDAKSRVSYYDGVSIFF